MSRTQSKLSFLPQIAVFCAAVLSASPINHAFADANSTLVVTIKPQKAIDEGAKWRYVVNGVPSVWYSSGHKVTGIEDGDVAIEGNSVPPTSGCRTPSRDIVEIRPGRPHLRELDYSTPTCR